MIELKNLKKIFPMGNQGTEALRGINLTLPARGLVCVLGASGCGKTTLLNILGGLDGYSAGEMWVDGREFSTFSEAEKNAYRNEKIGFVFQRSNLMDCLTAIENVALKAEIAGEKRGKERARTALGRVGLLHLAEKKPSTLSGGEAQRVALARAIVNEPAVLLADEPTGALDSKSGKEVMGLLKELSQQRLVVVVTHNIALAEEYADRILEMSDGVFVADRLLREQPQELPEKKPVQGKVGLSFVGAARLALHNFFHNKLRAALVSIACSIGVLGLAVVLTLVGWFNAFVKDMDAQSLRSFPVAAGGKLDVGKLLDAYVNPSHKGASGEIKINTLISTVYDQWNVSKELSPEYVEYVESMDASLYGRMSYDYGIDWNANLFTNLDVGGAEYTASADFLVELATSQNEIAQGAMSYITYFREMPDASDPLFDDYTLLAGHLPTNEGELLLVLNQDDSTYDYIFAMLGFYSLADIEGYLNGDLEHFKQTWQYEEVLAKEYSLFYNDLVYVKNPQNGLFEQKKNFSASVRPLQAQEGEGVNLRISGIVKSSDSYVRTSLKTGVYYTKALTEAMQAQATGSQLVQEMKAEYAATQAYTNPFTGVETSEAAWQDILRRAGGGENPVLMNIYPVDAQAKEKVLAYLNAWNDQHGEEEQVDYRDIGKILLDLLDSVSTPAKFTLLALALASILVACITSGVVCLMSVRERRKEIGILRCMGAKNREIALAFCLESGACGLFSGMIGVLLSYVVSALFFAKYAVNAVWLSFGGAMLCVCSLFVLNMLFAAVISTSLVRTNPARALTQE